MLFRQIGVQDKQIKFEQYFRNSPLVFAKVNWLIFIIWIAHIPYNLRSITLTSKRGCDKAFATALLFKLCIHFNGDSMENNCHELQIAGTLFQRFIILESFVYIPNPQLAPSSSGAKWRTQTNWKIRFETT